MRTCSKRTVLVFMIIAAAAPVVFAGGTSENPPLEKTDSDMAVIEETPKTVIFREADGNIVELPKNPGRPIICHNSIMDIWYMAGGKSLARIRGNVNVPEEAEGLPLLGTINTVNTELIMELEPDFLVFSAAGSQSNIRELFSGEGVQGTAITYNNYDDFRVILDLFTRLNGTGNIYNEELIHSEQRVQQIIEQVSEYGTGPSVCILFVTTKYVEAETRNTITGYMCKKLGARNIYTDDSLKGATRVKLSPEYIMEQDPDIIFAVTMGDVEECRARLEKDIAGSSIWGDLSAVKNGRFIYLDKSYSLYKPNRFYPEAFRIMAEYLYPEMELSYLEKD